MPAVLLLELLKPPCGITFTDDQGNPPAAGVVVTIYAGSIASGIVAVTASAGATITLSQQTIYTAAFSNTAIQVAPVTFTTPAASLFGIAVPGLNTRIVAFPSGSELTDLMMTYDGDYVPNWTGGLSLASDVVLDYQDINFRVRTNDPEYAGSTIGANLEDLYGRPNVSSTAHRGEASILHCLITDGRFRPEALSIQGVPMDINTIGYFIGLSVLSKLPTTVPFVTIVANL